MTELIYSGPQQSVVVQLPANLVGPGELPWITFVNGVPVDVPVEVADLMVGQQPAMFTKKTRRKTTKKDEADG